MPDDGRLGVGVRGEEDAARLRVELDRLAQQLRARHFRASARRRGKRATRRAALLELAAASSASAPDPAFRIR